MADPRWLHAKGGAPSFYGENLMSNGKIAFMSTTSLLASPGDVLNCSTDLAYSA